MVEILKYADVAEQKEIVRLQSIINEKMKFISKLESFYEDYSYRYVVVDDIETCFRVITFHEDEMFAFDCDYIPFSYNICLIKQIVIYCCPQFFFTTSQYAA